MKKIFLTVFLISILTCGCSKKVEQQECPVCEKQTECVQNVEKEKHPIEKELEECMEQKDYTTVGMNNCTYKAMDDWNKEIEKYLNSLKEICSKEDYSDILEAQKSWEEYKEDEFEVIDIIRDKQGTIYTNIAAGEKADIVKQRALQLKNLYDNVNE